MKASLPRILLVEDDIDDQYFFREALSLLSPALSCQVAENGVEALKLLKELPLFDIIFMDINMPKMNGIECLQVLKSNDSYKNIPVVILSTSSDQAYIERCKILGATYYFTKPIIPFELIKKLQDIFKKVF